MVSLIKLSSGAEIVGIISQSNNTHIDVTNPLQLNYFMKSPNHTPSVSIQRFIPFATDQDITFNRNHVLAIAIPKKGMLNYYDNALRVIQENVDKMIESELNDAAQPVEMSDDEMEATMAMVERIKGRVTIN